MPAKKPSKILLLVSPEDPACPAVLGNDRKYQAAPWWPLGYVIPRLVFGDEGALVQGYALFEPLATATAEWFPEDRLAQAIAAWKVYYGARGWSFFIITKGDPGGSPLKLRKSFPFRPES